MQTTAPDGTTISTIDSGEGPTVVLVPGSNFDAAALGGVAAALSTQFATYAMDRRGRGGSGDSDAFEIQREYEDVAAVIDAVPSPVTLFGHSYGALCCLGALRGGAEVDRLVLYEPPLPVDGPMPFEPFARARASFEAGDCRGALLVLLRDVVQVSADEFTFITSLPDEWFASFAATAVREMEAVNALDGDPNQYALLGVDTLFLLGSESPSHVTRATERLVSTMPAARIARLEGHGHNAVIGDPGLVAKHIASSAAHTGLGR